MYSVDFISKYESLLESMSEWIAGVTWDGHEKDCAAFAGATGECCCIKSIREEWHKLYRLREIEHMHATAEDAGDKYTNEVLEDTLKDLKQARECIWDMLEGDDGQAWDKAGKFMRSMEAKRGALKVSVPILGSTT
jgi:uncharacterized membrane protein YcjF (UPF0283 family)